MIEQNKPTAPVVVFGEHKMGAGKSFVSAVALLRIGRKWNPGHAARQPKAEPYYRQFDTRR